MNTVSSKFLDSVAAYCIARGMSPERTVFVLPNKRSAMFMRTYYKDRLFAAGRPALMPSFVTLTSFIEQLSPLSEASHSELLFILYDCYRRVMERLDRGDEMRSFDDFLFWGELILSDFSEIDAAAVDASELFTNVVRVNSLQSTYFSEGQADVIEQLWGYRPPVSDEVEHFWRHIISDPDTDTSEEDRGTKHVLSKDFINLWEILGELYNVFTSALLDRRIGYRGMVLAQAAKTLAEDDVLRDCDRVVFVGLGGVGERTNRIFRRLKQKGVADFFWDIPALLAGPDSKIFDKSSHYMRRLRRQAAEFAMPDDFEMPPACKPKIEIVDIPSSMMQAQVAADTLRHWNNFRKINARFDNTAVIMPDAALLPSLLNTLPDTPGGTNITMGLPQRQTPLATLIRTIVSMHLRMRVSQHRPMFYYEDVKELVSNPTIVRIDPEGCAAIIKEIDTRRLYTVFASELVKIAPSLEYIFALPQKEMDVDGARSYLSTLIDGLCQATGYKPDDNADTPEFHEYQVLHSYRAAINEIFDLITKYDVPVIESTYFRLVEKMLWTRTLDIEGAPLRGLQVMGLLESRAIDFNNLIVLSMNERILPRHNPLRTLIPHMLRRAYGMTTIDDVEDESAYNFFRLFSRTQNVTLVYDSRVSGVAAGEMSRYLLQMEHLLPEGIVSHRSVRLGAHIGGERTISIAKDDEVMALLGLFREGAPADKARRFSASMLKDFIACPLRFYLKHVRKLSDEDETAMFMDAATYGSIIHKVLETLYMGLPENARVAPFRGFSRGRLVDADVIDRMLESPIRSLVLSTIDNVYYRDRYKTTPDDMPGEARVLSAVIEKIVRKTLSNEITPELDSFIFLAAETGPKGVWEMAPGLRVNFVSKIDRVDQLDATRLRFIDYKTGSDRPVVRACADLFGQTKSLRNDAIFQLLLYCHAAHEMDGEKREIRPEIYRLKSVYVDPATTIGVGTSQRNTPISSYTDESVAEFRPLLTDMVQRIFDPGIPFDQTSDRDNCRYCAFAQMCARSVSVDNPF